MIHNITIRNYRNIQNLNIKAERNQLLIIAPNGSGKTNLLESIFFSIFGASFRPLESYRELVKLGEDFATIHVDWSDKTTLEMTIRTNPRLSKSVKFMGKVKSRKLILQKYPIVLFAPHSIDLVNGEPEIRRRDIDFFLSTLDADYADVVQKYKKTLKNRNAVIKQIQVGNASKDQLDFWTENLCEFGAKITTQRANLLSELKVYTQKLFKDFYHNINFFDIEFLPNLNFENGASANEVEQLYLEKFGANYEKEIVVGKTLYGAHKDDYKFVFDSKSMRYQGSRGQQRIASFIFKIAQFLLLKDKNKIEDALFLIDDLMSELDEKHRRNIAEYIYNEKISCIITGANESEIPEIILQNFQKIVLPSQEND